jgi:hypothetical protein
MTTVGLPLDRVFAKTYRSQGGTALRRPPFFRTKKIALLGSTASLSFAPWHDPSWTLIAHPCCRPQCQREPDWYFDMHRPECFRTDRKQWNPNYYAWLKALQTPIFMQENWPEIPMAVRYPFEHVEAEYKSSVTGALYATNHCAYMFPLALMEGVTHIGLYGCQYAGHERKTQRGSLLYWMGRFEGAGGTLVVPQTHNDLLTEPLYGYASHDDQGKLLPVYRPQLVVDTPTRPQTVLLEPSEVPLAPLPPGEPVRTFEMAYA